LGFPGKVFNEAAFMHITRDGHPRGSVINTRFYGCPFYGIIPSLTDLDTILAKFMRLRFAN